MNLAIIGGSQSTGSSLLRQVLHRHSLIYCLDESHLFCKPELYQSFDKNKNRLFKKGLGGLKSAGWHHMNGLDMDLKSQNALKKLWDESAPSHLQELFVSIQNLAPDAHASLLMDKTPANVFVVEPFLKLNDKNKAIITVRDPFDIMCSLHKRGMHIVDIVAIVKSSCIASSKLKNQSKVHFVRYEDLVTDSSSVIEKILEFLELDFEPDMLQNSTEATHQNTKIDGWHYDETDQIQKGAVGAFDKLPLDEQAYLISAFEQIIWQNLENEMLSFFEAFNYVKRTKSTESDKPGFNIRSVLMKKTTRNHHYNILNNPLSLSR